MGFLFVISSRFTFLLELQRSYLAAVRVKQV